MPDDGYIDTVDEVVAALEQDPILVQQVAGNGHTEEVIAWLREHVQQVDAPVYVALTGPIADLPDSRTSEELARLLHARLDEPGVYVVSAASYPAIVAYDVEIDDSRVDSEAFGVTQPARDAHRHSGLSTTGETALLVRAAAPDEIGPNYLDTLLETPGMALVRPDEEIDFLWQPPDPWPLTAVPIIAGLVVWAVAMVALRPLADLIVPGRLAPRPTTTGGGDRLAREREAAREFSRTRKFAKQSIKHLEKALAQAADAEAEALARAQLAAELATGLVDSDDVIEVVGAAMLATQAVARLSGDTAWKPCFFDPLHDESSTTAALAGLPVPACRDCAADVASGRQPDGLLLVGRRGQRKDPYWERDSVWSRTGFGALAEDFPEQVARATRGTRRRR